jgi:hypothetical protein
MAGWLIEKLRGDQGGRRVQQYVDAVSTEPDEGDVRWLATAGDGDEDRARWELRYARRAIGLLVAQRDALDDRTASVVARELHRALQMDRNVAASMVLVAEKQLTDRVRAYRAGLEGRALGEAVERRLARVLVGGTRSPSQAEVLERGAAIAQRYLDGAHEALRRAFGVADVPTEQPPSAWKTGPVR